MKPLNPPIEPKFDYNMSLSITFAQLEFIEAEAKKLSISRPAYIRLLIDDRIEEFKYYKEEPQN